MTTIQPKSTASEWTTFKLKDCATLINGRAYKQNELLNNGPHKVIRIQNLKGGSNWYYSDLQLKEEKYCHNGDLLFAWSATFGPFIWSGDKAIFHYHIWKVEPNTEVLDKDFAYFLLLWITEEIRAQAHGIAMLHVTKSGMENYDVAIPPLSHQRKIAARLKAQLLETANARKAVEEQFRALLVLETRCREDALRELDDSERVPLGQLLHGIEAGKSFKTTELPARPSELGVLKVSAVSWDEFAPDEAKAVESNHIANEKHLVRKGDLIMSRANTIQLVGAVVKAKEDYPFRLLSDKTLRLVVDEAVALSGYLLTVLKWPEARAFIEQNATGTSDSMRNISQKNIKQIPIPKLTLEKQSDIAMRSRAVNVKLDRIRSALKNQQSLLARLPNKIVAQAFET